MEMKEDDTECMTYRAAFHFASFGLHSEHMQVKQAAFSASSVFYCRALTKGGERIPNRLPSASEALIKCEDWLVNWRHNTLMHNFSINCGCFITPTSGNDIKSMKYVIDDFASVTSRLQIAMDLASYRVKRFTTDSIENLDKFDIVEASKPKQQAVNNVITARSLHCLDGVDPLTAVASFKSVWSMFIIIDTLRRGEECFICSLQDLNSIYGSAFLIEGLSLVYSTASKGGHLTEKTTLQRDLLGFRSDAGHGGGEYFKWDKVCD